MIAIRIEELSKQYRLGQIGTGTLSHDINRWWANVRGKDDPYSEVGQTNRRDGEKTGDYVWALRDVSLEVKQGDVLGVIGGNGAGKSTLLKLISRITSPSNGTIKIKGRVASLLEVGTGMHPELTARENIYLNGSILGMRKAEVAHKFDDIVDFAGCNLYTDTPVKRFSSGMRVRLGFAVAAFLEPEILIVDEVLAVGDASFQDRALGKMKEVTASGRTVLFVSHTMSAIQRLCPRTAVLEDGRLAAVGPTSEMVSKYLTHTASPELEWINAEVDNGESAIRRIAVSTEANHTSLTSGDTLRISIDCHITQKCSDTRIAVAINDSFGNPLFSAMPQDSDCPNPVEIGLHRYDFKLPGPILRAQQYALTAALYSKSRIIHHKLENVLRFTLQEAQSAFLAGDTDRVGILQIPCTWTHARTNTPVTYE